MRPVSEHIKIMIHVRGSLIRTNNLGLLWSGPVALLTSRSLNKVLIPEQDTLLIGISGRTCYLDRQNQLHLKDYYLDYGLHR